MDSGVDLPKPFGISHSKLATFRRCKQQYHWKYVDKYFPKSSMGQTRGTAGHAALANWHVHYDPVQAMQAAWNSWYSEGFEGNDQWKILEDALNRYFVWSAANDTFKIVSSEYKFEIEYVVEQEPYTVKFTGFIDGIVEEDNRLWLLENKFHKRVDTSNLDMDMQATLYLLAASLMDKQVEGVIYNIIRVGDTKVALTEPVVRKRLHRNLAGLTRVQQEVISQANEMIAYEKGGVPYRNPTKDCSWDCSFHAACLSMLDDGIESQQQLASVSHVKKDEEVKNDE